MSGKTPTSVMPEILSATVPAVTGLVVVTSRGGVIGSLTKLPTSRVAPSARLRPVARNVPPVPATVSWAPPATATSPWVADPTGRDSRPPLAVIPPAKLVPELVRASEPGPDFRKVPEAPDMAPP